MPMLYDAWEESALVEIKHMQHMIESRRNELRAKVVADHMEPEHLQSVLAAIYANGVMDSALWRMEARLRGDSGGV